MADLVDVDEVKAFFFKAMSQGYANAKSGMKVPDMPGFKEIKFREGDFELLDRWGKHPDTPRSFGTTYIWHKGIPVWTMSYGGYYFEEAIPVLRAALRSNYEVHRFIGCRGPRQFEVDGMKYINAPRLNEFWRFEGREEIFTKEAKNLGYHEYWGMSLNYPMARRD